MFTVCLGCRLKFFYHSLKFYIHFTPQTSILTTKHNANIAPSLSRSQLKNCKAVDKLCTLIAFFSNKQCFISIQLKVFIRNLHDNNERYNAYIYLLGQGLKPKGASFHIQGSLSYSYASKTYLAK